MKKIDDTDRQLLQLLQQEGRMTRSDLAKAVGKSIPAVSDRMRRLEDDGVIQGYVTLVAPRKMGLELMAFVIIRAGSPAYFESIIELTKGETSVLECHALTGEGSHLLKVYTKNTEELEQLLSRIRSWPGVKNTRTSIVLSSPKSTTALPLGQPPG